MKTNVQKFSLWLSETEVKYDNSVSLSDFSYFKSGRKADLILFPSNQEQLAECIRVFNEYEI